MGVCWEHRSDACVCVYDESARSDVRCSLSLESHLSTMSRMITRTRSSGSDGRSNEDQLCTDIIYTSDA